EVRRRRAVGLRRQSRRLRTPPQAGRSPLPAGRNRVVPRRGDEQLHLEPSLDLQAPARARRLPGTAVPHRRGTRVRRQPARADRPRRSGGRRQDRRPGGRDRARHAAELHREQALVVSPLRAAAVVALAALLVAPSTRAGENPRLTRDQAIAIFLGYSKGADVLKRYPPKPTTDASFKNETWNVSGWAEG